MTATGMLSNAAPVKSSSSGIEPQAPPAVHPGEPLVVTWKPDLSGSHEWKNMDITLVSYGSDGKKTYSKKIASGVDGTNGQNATLKTTAPKSQHSTTHALVFTDGHKTRTSPKFAIMNKNGTYSKFSARDESIEASNSDSSDEPHDSDQDDSTQEASSNSDEHSLQEQFKTMIHEEMSQISDGSRYAMDYLTPSQDDDEVRDSEKSNKRSANAADKFSQAQEDNMVRASEQESNKRSNGHDDSHDAMEYLSMISQEAKSHSSHKPSSTKSNKNSSHRSSATHPVSSSGRQANGIPTAANDPLGHQMNVSAFLSSYLARQSSSVYSASTESGSHTTHKHASKARESEANQNSQKNSKDVSPSSHGKHESAENNHASKHSNNHSKAHGSSLSKSSSSLSGSSASNLKAAKSNSAPSSHSARSTSNSSSTVPTKRDLHAEDNADSHMAWLNQAMSQAVKATNDLGHIRMHNSTNAHAASHKSNGGLNHAASVTSTSGSGSEHLSSTPSRTLTRGRHSTSSPTSGSSSQHAGHGALSSQMSSNGNSRNATRGSSDFMDVLRQGLTNGSGLSPKQISEYYLSAQKTSGSHRSNSGASMSIHAHRGSNSVSMSY